MPNGDHGMWRLIAGIVLLAALLLFAPPASAHGQPEGASVFPAKPLAAAGHSLAAGAATPADGCDGGLACCLFGHCSMETIALLATSAGPLAGPAEAAYGRPVVSAILGLRHGPATPPPRLAR